MVLSFLSSIAINQFNSWSIIEENRKKISIQQNGIQNWIAWLQQSNKIENGILHFRGIELNCSFFPEEERHWLNSVISSNIWVGNIFSKNHIWREKHMIKKECMRLPILMPPRPVAINKATSITSVNATQARPYNISFMIVISYQWWYFRMPQGEIAEARRRYSSSLYSFHLLCFYRSFDYINIDTCAL